MQCPCCLTEDEAITINGQTCPFCTERIAINPEYPQMMQMCRTMESDLDYMVEALESMHAFDRAGLQQAIQDKAAELMVYALKLAVMVR